MSDKEDVRAAPDDTVRPAPDRTGPAVAAPVGNRALAGMSPTDLLQMAAAVPAMGNAVLGRLLGPPTAGAGADPLRDPRFNPESLVDRLARAIDSDEIKVVNLAYIDMRTGAYVPAKFVRHVDAAAAAAVLDDLTTSQAQAVAQLYRGTEGRPLEQDLFGGGNSGFPSDLAEDATARLRALMQGTRPDRPVGVPEPPAMDSRIEADAAELHQLLAHDLSEADRERVMALHRRKVEEIDRLDAAYARLFHGELSVVLGGKLTGLQRTRMALLRDGDQAKADACAIEDKRRAIELIDKQMRPFGVAARLLPSFGPVDLSELSKRRAALVADIQGVVAANVDEAGSPEAVRQKLGAILATKGSSGVHSLGEELETTLGAGAGQAITATANGDAVTAAARKLLELEITHTTHTDAIAPLLRGLRAQAYRDVQSMVFDERVAASQKDRIGQNPEAAADGLARQYVQAFITTYDGLRGPGGGRSWADIVDSASSGNEALLRALAAGGGAATDLQDLEFALSRGDANLILGVLGRQPSGKQINDLVQAYDGEHGSGSLKMRLFGPFGAQNASETDRSPMMPGGLLHGRDASRAAEALDMPLTMGGKAEVDWLARGGFDEVHATESTSGLTGWLREKGDVPETQQQMRNSAARLLMAQGEYGADPWATDQPGILGRARRVRATLSGDAAAYEKENEALREKLRQGVSFAVTVALGLALPGLGYGFAATLALNIGGTVVTNLSVYGEKYSLTNFRNDVLGGLLGGLGGALGEQVVGAVATRVATRSAGAAAAVIEREGLTVALTAEASAGVTVLKWGGSAVGQSAGTSVATGHNEFGWGSFGMNMGLSGLGHAIHGPRPAGSAAAADESAPVRESGTPEPSPVAEPELAGAGAGTATPGGAGPTPQGGMRGAGVLPLAERPLITEADLPEIRRLLVQEGAVGGLREKATFDPTPVPAETMRVPVGLDAKAELIYTPVRLDVVLAAPAAGGVHGLASGHAANRLTFEGGTWRARIEIDPRLEPRDAQLALRHEVNEVAGIVGKLHERGLTGQDLNGAIAAEQRAGLTREGARGDKATEHDHATAVDLVELYRRYLADPSPANQETLDRQVQAMGFAARSFGQERLVAPADAEMRPVTGLEQTRDQLIREHAPKDLQEPLLEYIDQWRRANTPQTPFVPADYPDVAARIREYTDALAGRAADAGPFAGLTPEARMDAIEILAQTGAEGLTVKDLVGNGMDPAVAARVVEGLNGRNPYRNLYAELETMMTLRRRAQAAHAKGEPPESVGFGQTRRLRSVEVMTEGGPLEGQPFEVFWERLQAAAKAGEIEPAATGDPLRPQFAPTADPDAAVRLTWHFRPRPGAEVVDSTFVLDLPGKKSGRGFRTADLIGAHFEPAKPEGGAAGEHVSGTGVVVPADSAPSHLVVTPDPVLQQLLDKWGLRFQRLRLFDEYKKAALGE